jgi:hypothetical protein
VRNEGELLEALKSPFVLKNLQINPRAGTLSDRL